jgi:hypothetical protein
LELRKSIILNIKTMNSIYGTIKYFSGGPTAPEQLHKT